MYVRANILGYYKWFIRFQIYIALKTNESFIVNLYIYWNNLDLISVTTYMYFMGLNNNHAPSKPKSI
jgi:hypothetical protein